MRHHIYKNSNVPKVPEEESPLCCSIRLKGELRDKLIAKAKKEAVPHSQVIRWALMHYFDPANKNTDGSKQ